MKLDMIYVMMQIYLKIKLSKIIVENYFSLIDILKVKVIIMTYNVMKNVSESITLKFLDLYLKVVSIMCIVKYYV